MDQSIAKTMNKSGWSIAYSSARGRGGRHLGYWEDKLPSLARRIKGVHLENRPAVEILDRLAREDKHHHLLRPALSDTRMPRHILRHSIQRPQAGYRAGRGAMD